MTTYVASMLRHCLAWAGGEDIDPKSGLSHLAHLGANVNLLLDAAHCGTLVDDRPKMPVKLGLFTGKMDTSIEEEDPNWRKTDHGFVWTGPPVPLDFAVPTGMNGIQPMPAGHRMLEEGEILQAGDEFVDRHMPGSLSYQPVLDAAVGSPLLADNVGFYRRPIYSGADL